jgi:hypothetical protein
LAGAAKKKLVFLEGLFWIKVFILEGGPWKVSDIVEQD